MDLFKQDMKGPSRPAPSVPSFGVTRYSPVTNWDNDPFGADVFEPTPNLQKKKPPPRPPPPRVSKQPDLPAKPSHFMRKPTVLSSLLSRKPKNTPSQNMPQPTVTDVSELEPHRMFPKCEPKNVHTGALIDLSSPPSSPTFTTRSSSDGLSVDSFGSDATTSTNHFNHHNGNASQAESGFEDDFDLFLNSRKMSKDDTLENVNGFIDPFSPPPISSKPSMRKPVINKDLFDVSSISSQSQAPLKGPTIIRAKPARPKPPDNSALLKNTFGPSFSVTSMNINTTTPIQKISNGFGDSYESKSLWECESPEREGSPPMPNIPPPPPPQVSDDDLPEPVWPSDEDLDEHLHEAIRELHEAPRDLHEPKRDLHEAVRDLHEQLHGAQEEPYAIALFDYHTDHQDDLCFSVDAKIKLIRRIDDEWLFGSLRNGVQGTFPANYVEIKVPLSNEVVPTTPSLGSAVALYDLEPEQAGDLRLSAGDTVTIRYKLNDQWYFGECNGLKGQFPINYVQMS